MAIGQEIRITDVPFNNVLDDSVTVFINDKGKLRQTDLTTVAKHSELYTLILDAHQDALSEIQTEFDKSISSLQDTESTLREALNALHIDLKNDLAADHETQVAEMSELIEAGHSKLLEDISTVDDLREKVNETFPKILGDSYADPKNILPYPYKDTTHTDSGVTWTIDWVDNGDGTVTFEGDSDIDETVEMVMGYGAVFTCGSLTLPKGKYNLSSGIKYPRDCYVQVVDTSGGSLDLDNPNAIAKCYSEVTPFTLVEDTKVRVELVVPWGTGTYEKTMFKPMISPSTYDGSVYYPYVEDVDTRLKTLEISETIPSHIGMVIHSTTLDTMEKVIAIYGGVTWTKIEGQFLLGQSSLYDINSVGGTDSHHLTAEDLPAHTHTVGAHSHGLNNHNHSIPALSGTAASNGAHGHSVTFNGGGPVVGMGGDGMPNVTTGGGGFTYVRGATAQSNGAHEHSITTKASTTGGATGSTANSAAFETGKAGKWDGLILNNMPPYKTVYIWERTA